MTRNARFSLVTLAALLTTVQCACTNEFTTAVRDAVINGTASFVEAATTEILNQWFAGAIEN